MRHRAHVALRRHRARDRHRRPAAQLHRRDSYSGSGPSSLATSARFGKKWSTCSRVMCLGRSNRTSSVIMSALLIAWPGGTMLPAHRRNGQRDRLAGPTELGSRPNGVRTAWPRRSRTSVSTQVAATEQSNSRDGNLNRSVVTDRQTPLGYPSQNRRAALRLLAKIGHSPSAAPLQASSSRESPAPSRRCGAEFERWAEQCGASRSPSR